MNVYTTDRIVMWFYLVMGDVVRRVLWKQWLIWQA